MAVMNIGKKIRQLRESKNISQKKLAEMSGLTQGYISALEKKSDDCRLDPLYAICKALGISLSDFFSDKEVYDGTDLCLMKGNEIEELIKEIGIEYLVLSKEMKDENISPEKLRKTLDSLKALGLLKNEKPADD